MDKKTRQILHNNFNMKKVCLKMVLRLLTPEQVEIRMNTCADILQNIENDPESNVQSMHWKSPISPRQKKARQSKSKFKAMMLVFFDIRGIVHVDLVPEGQTVNQVDYKEVLTNLCERVRRRRPEMWKNGSWVLHQMTHRHTTPCLSRCF